MKLIIVDDSVSFRERIRTLVLKHKNVDVIGESGNGKDALQIIRDKKPDMIITDVRMPFMNGIQLLRKLKEEGDKTIVCILTSYAYPQYKKKCMELGATYFFNKSNDFWKLDIVIKKIMETFPIETDDKTLNQKAEERFRSYFELPFTGRAITSPSKGWIEVNQALCDMLGYTKSELIKTNWAELTHPDDLE